VTAVYENPEMVRLFRAYTNPQAPERDSTGDHLTRASYEDHLDAPLIVTTDTHVALFAGAGAPPSTQGFRHGTLGFKELAGISHVGPAIASLVRLAELGREQLWRADAERLLADLVQVRAANNVALWRDAIGAESFAGREERIAAMVDHACVISARYLERALHEPGYLGGPSLRADLLSAHPVGFDRIMVATFALVGANNSARLIRWFDTMDVAWDRALVMLTGRQGRLTSRITLATHSLARIFQLASRGFVGGSVNVQMGGPWYAVVGLGRTDARPYFNLNFDPNDAVTLGVGHQSDTSASYTVFVVADNRFHTQQRDWHANVKIPVGNTHGTFDLLRKSGLSDVGYIKAWGFSANWDWPGWFARVAYDPYQNFSAQNAWRLAGGVRF